MGRIEERIEGGGMRKEEGRMSLERFRELLNLHIVDKFRSDLPADFREQVPGILRELLEDEETIWTAHRIEWCLRYVKSHFRRFDNLSAMLNNPYTDEAYRGSRAYARYRDQERQRTADEKREPMGWQAMMFAYLDDANRTALMLGFPRIDRPDQWVVDPPERLPEKPGTESVVPKMVPSTGPGRLRSVGEVMGRGKREKLNLRNPRALALAREIVAVAGEDTLRRAFENADEVLKAIGRGERTEEI